MSRASTICRLFSAAALLTTTMPVSAQQLGLPSGAGPATFGPTTTVGSATFNLNTPPSTTFSSYTPTTTVSISISNQQFSSGPTPGITAGSVSGNSLSALAPTAVYQATSSIGSPSNSEYTTMPFGTAGSGFSTSSFYGFRMFTDATYLDSAGAGGSMASLSGRYYYGDLTITFSRPVLNPVIHLAGLGGGVSTSTSSNFLGLYTEFTLSSANISAGYSLTKLSGTTYFNVTDSTIVNSSTTPTTLKTSTYYGSQATGNSASGGSVRINTNGTSVTSVTFKVYLRGDGGFGTGNKWADTTRTGDAYLITSTLGLYTVSGTVYDDGNGLTDNTVNGTATTLSGLFANLIDDNGNLYASTSVVSGAYSFSNVIGGNYKVVLTTSASSTTAALPSGWVNTGEHLGTTTGSDGTVDGILSISVGKSVSETNVTNANFGIDKLPVADAKNYNVSLSAFSSTPPTGYPSVSGYVSIKASSSALTGYTLGGSLTGSDLEDCTTAGSCNATKTFKVGTINSNTKVYYNNGAGAVLLSTGSLITNFDANKLVIYGPTTGGTLGFTYALVDNASMIGSYASYTITASIVLPLELLTFSGTSHDCQAALHWETGAEQQLSLFELQYSTDGRNFETVASVFPKGSGSRYDIAYAQAAGKGLYRLKISGLDNKTDYSSTVSVSTSCDAPATVTVYPNPTSGLVQVRGMEAGQHVTVYSLQGAALLNMQPDGSAAVIDMSTFAPGIYQLVITNSSGLQQRVQIVKR
jgi:hypothetical protein